MDGNQNKKIVPSVLLSNLTTLRVGGSARFVYRVESEEDLRDCATFIRTQELPWRVIGGGSNLLIPDEGFDGCIVRMKIMGKEIIYEDTLSILIKVSAGESWDAFVAYAVTQGWWGIENLSGIPGSVGATPIQNVGAYGVEAGDVIESIETFHIETGKTRVFSNEECAFGYRNSFFKSKEGKNYIVTSVLFRLIKNGTPKIDYKDLANIFVVQTKTPMLTEIRDTILSIRKEKFPDISMVGTAGSFFKNLIVDEEKYKELETLFPGVPSYPMSDHRRKIPLAWILDNILHLNGYSLGKVSLFERQPLVLVAKSGATAKEIDAFARSIETMVFEKTGIMCEREVQTLI